MPTDLAAIGITSQQQAAELEHDLGVRFDDFTPEDCETWLLQTVYLDKFSRTRAVSLAADDADVSIRTVRQWQAENILGFNHRLEIAVLRYTDVLEVMLLQRAQEPDSPPSLLMMLLRAHMPEKYGSARRSPTPRDDSLANHHRDHDPQPTTTSQYDRELLEEIFQDLQNLKQFTGLTEPDFMPREPDPNLSPAGRDTSHSDLSPVGDENPAHSNLSPAGRDTSHSDLSPSGGETQRGGVPSPDDHRTPVLADQPGYVPAPSTQNLEPPLNRRQRRELQRRAKREKSHLARAPN